jgi:hypothetical protein
MIDRLAIGTQESVELSKQLAGSSELVVASVRAIVSSRTLIEHSRQRVQRFGATVRRH